MSVIGNQTNINETQYFFLEVNSQLITTSTIKGNTGVFSTIFAQDARISSISGAVNISTINLNYLSSQRAYISSLTSDVINTSTINSVLINTSTIKAFDISSLTGYISTFTTDHISSQTASISTIKAFDISSLTGYISTFTTDRLSSLTGYISTFTSDSGLFSNLVATGANISNLVANVANISNLTATNINGQPVANYSASNWYNFPAQGNVTATLGLFGIPQYNISNFLNLTVGNSITAQGGSINAGVNVGAGVQVFAPIGSFGVLTVSEDINVSATNETADVNIYGANLLAGDNALYVEGGTTLTGGGIIHGVTIGALQVAGIDTVRIDVLPAGMALNSATFITQNAAGAINLAAGGALSLAGGSYIEYNTDENRFINTTSGNDFTDIYVGNIHASFGGSAPLRINDSGRGVELANVNSMTMTTQLAGVLQWSPSTNYAVGNKVKFLNIYYNALVPNCNLQPNIPIPAFNSNNSYDVNDIVFVSGSGSYRNIISVIPPVATPPNGFWSFVGATDAITQVWAVFNPYVATITGDDVSQITMGNVIATNINTSNLTVDTIQSSNLDIGATTINIVANSNIYMNGISSIVLESDDTIITGLSNVALFSQFGNVLVGSGLQTLITGGLVVNIQSSGNIDIGAVGNLFAQCDGEMTLNSFSNTLISATGTIAVGAQGDAQFVSANGRCILASGGSNNVEINAVGTGSIIANTFGTGGILLYNGSNNGIGINNTGVNLGSDSDIDLIASNTIILNAPFVNILGSNTAIQSISTLRLSTGTLFANTIQSLQMNISNINSSNITTPALSTNTISTATLNVNFINAPTNINVGKTIIPSVGTIDLGAQGFNYRQLFISSIRCVSSIITSTITTDRLFPTFDSGVRTANLYPNSAGAQIGFGPALASGGFYNIGTFRSTITTNLLGASDGATTANNIKVVGHLSTTSLGVSTINFKQYPFISTLNNSIATATVSVSGSATSVLIQSNTLRFPFPGHYRVDQKYAIHKGSGGGTHGSLVYSSNGTVSNIKNAVNWPTQGMASVAFLDTANFSTFTTATTTVVANTGNLTRNLYYFDDGSGTYTTSLYMSPPVITYIPSPGITPDL